MGADWFKKAKIYHIFLDRFAGYDDKKDWKKPQFCGGNIQGVIQKLDYIKDLGIDTVWLSPFYVNKAYHGYHIEDFREIDKRFGTKKDLKELIKLLKQNNMRLIIDFVPNHCSSEHPFFLDAKSNKDSKYRDWFYFTKWPDEYISFFGFDVLPKLNLDNEEARQYMIDTAKYWLSLGVDGFRIDYVLGPSHSFFKELNRQIKQDYPDAVLIGEAWLSNFPSVSHSLNIIRQTGIKHKCFRWIQGKFNGAPDGLLKEYIGELDGVLDFNFYYLIQRYLIDTYNPKKLKKKLEKHYSRFPKGYFLPTVLDNHDVDRFLFRSKDKETLKEAAKIQKEVGQPIIIYYGTEIGMTQSISLHKAGMYGDTNARQTMRWDNQDKELLSFFKQLLKGSR